LHGITRTLNLREFNHTRSQNQINKERGRLRAPGHPLSVSMIIGKGRAVAQAISRWLPTAAARVRIRADMWGLWWTKRYWGRFSPSTSVSPANHHPTNFSIIIITRGWHNRPNSGRSAEWTQLDSTPHYTNLKKWASEYSGWMVSVHVHCFHFFFHSFILPYIYLNKNKIIVRYIYICSLCTGIIYTHIIVICKFTYFLGDFRDFEG
jgi:hypothetical protein